MNLRDKRMIHAFHAYFFLKEQDLEKMRYSRWFLENVASVCKTNGLSPTADKVLLDMASKLAYGLAKYHYDHDGDGGIVIVPTLPMKLTEHQLELVHYSPNPDEFKDYRQSRSILPKLRRRKAMREVESMIKQGILKETT